MVSGTFVEPVAAWLLVIEMVGIASSLLGFLHEISHDVTPRTPPTDEPRRYREAA